MRDDENDKNDEIGEIMIFIQRLRRVNKRLLSYIYFTPYASCS